MAPTISAKSIGENQLSNGITKAGEKRASGAGVSKRKKAAKIGHMKPQLAENTKGGMCRHQLCETKLSISKRAISGHRKVSISVSGMTISRHQAESIRRNGNQNHQRSPGKESATYHQMAYGYGVNKRGEAEAIRRNINIEAKAKRKAYLPQ